MNALTLNKYFYFIRLMRNERRPPEQLRMIQNEKLKQLIVHANRHVPFYRNRFKKLNLRPEDIRTVDDLYKIPVIDKNEILAHPATDFLDERIKDRRLLSSVSTSGSSGQVLEFFVDDRYNQLRKAQFLRPYITNGIGLRSLILGFSGRPSVKQQMHQKLGFLKECQVYSGLSPEKQIKIINQMKPTIMRGYGSTFHLMASRIIEQGLAVHAPKTIFTDSERLSRASRKTIETAFAAEVIDIYGTFETENIGYECREHNGYHMAVDCVIMELIKDGQPTATGEEGEIVCTVLDNLTFPFIRYNLHDMATWHDTPCSCGRTFPLINKINGRAHHFLKKPDGSKISSTSAVSHIWHLGKYLHEFQIVQKTVDQLTILVVPSRHYSAKIENQIIGSMRHDFTTAEIKIETVAHIPREPSGKLLDFKSFLQD